jgi:predicted transcriptional regulator of viral defense system
MPRRSPVSGNVSDRRTDPSDVDWTFLTNHGHVLLAIAADPTLRLRDIADIVGVTERTAVGIISDLEEAGYIRREKVGRRNHYLLDPSRPLRHPVEAHHQVGDLLDAIKHSSPPD